MASAVLHVFQGRYQTHGPDTVNSFNSIGKIKWAETEKSSYGSH